MRRAERFVIRLAFGRPNFYSTTSLPPYDAEPWTADLKYPGCGGPDTSRGRQALLRHGTEMRTDYRLLSVGL